MPFEVRVFDGLIYFERMIFGAFLQFKNFAEKLVAETSLLLLQPKLTQKVKTIKCLPLGKQKFCAVLMTLGSR